MKAVVVGALVAVCLGCLMALVTATRDARRARSRLPIPADPRLARAAEERHARLHRALTAADIALTSTEALRLAGWSVLAAAPVGFLLGGPALAVAAVLAAAAAGPAALLALHGRRDRRADAGLPSVLDDIARALRAGVAPVAAMEAASREPGERAARSDLRAVVDDVQAGLALVDALERWRERRPSGPVRLAVGSLAIGVSTGGTRSQAVEAVAATLRERQAVEREAARPGYPSEVLGRGDRPGSAPGSPRWRASAILGPPRSWSGRPSAGAA